MKTTQSAIVSIVETTFQPQPRNKASCCIQKIWTVYYCIPIHECYTYLQSTYCYFRKITISTPSLKSRSPSFRHLVTGHEDTLQIMKARNCNNQLDEKPLPVGCWSPLPTKGLWIFFRNDPQGGNLWGWNFGIYGIYWGCMGWKLTSSPENQWLVPMYFLLK